MSETVEKVFVRSRQLLLDSVRLAARVWDSGFRPDFLVGVWRGGTPPAIAIHEFFRARGHDPYHTTIKTQSYSGMQRGEAGVEVKGLQHVLDVIRATDSVLVVDDVFDTGHTMVAILETLRARARRNMPDCRIATVYYKPLRNETDIKPYYFVVEDNRWIVFPHELEGLTEDEISQKGPGVAEAVFGEAAR